MLMSLKILLSENFDVLFKYMGHVRHHKERGHSRHTKVVQAFLDFLELCLLIGNVKKFLGISRVYKSSQREDGLIRHPFTEPFTDVLIKALLKEGSIAIAFNLLILRCLVKILNETTPHCSENVFEDNVSTGVFVSEVKAW